MAKKSKIHKSFIKRPDLEKEVKNKTKVKVPKTRQPKFTAITFKVFSIDIIPFPDYNRIE
jgi:hypothetical protein